MGNRKPHTKRRRSKKSKLSSVSAKGNRIKTCEKIPVEYQIRTNADGMGIVNGFSTALVDAFCDATTFEDMTQSSSYANLWKSYRITGVKYQFFPFYTESQTNDDSGAGVTNNQLKWFWYRYQSGAGLIEQNPQNTTEIYTQNPKFRLFNKPIVKFFRRPRMTGSGYTDSSSTGTVAEMVQTGMKNNWLSTDSYPNVSHYGLQFGLANATPNVTYILKCVKTIYMELRDQH